MIEKRGDLKMEDDHEGPSPAARVVMVVSAAFTAAVFGYLLYEAVTAEAGDPYAEVVRTEARPDGLLVEVRLVNPGGAGMRDAEVEVKCGDPPIAVHFTNVPAEATRTALVLCPPDTQGAPEVGVAWWTEP